MRNYVPVKSHIYNCMCCVCKVSADNKPSMGGGKGVGNGRALTNRSS